MKFANATDAAMGASSRQKLRELRVTGPAVKALTAEV